MSEEDLESMSGLDLLTFILETCTMHEYETCALEFDDMYLMCYLQPKPSYELTSDKVLH